MATPSGQTECISNRTARQPVTCTHNAHTRKTSLLWWSGALMLSFQKIGNSWIRFCSAVGQIKMHSVSNANAYTIHCAQNLQIWVLNFNIFELFRDSSHLSQPREYRYPSFLYFFLPSEYVSCGSLTCQLRNTSDFTFRLSKIAKNLVLGWQLTVLLWPHV